MRASAKHSAYYEWFQWLFGQLEKRVRVPFALEFRAATPRPIHRRLGRTSCWFEASRRPASPGCRLVDTTTTTSGRWQPYRTARAPRRCPRFCPRGIVVDCATCIGKAVPTRCAKVENQVANNEPSRVGHRIEVEWLERCPRLVYNGRKRIRKQIRDLLGGQGRSRHYGIVVAPSFPKIGLASSFCR